MSANVDVVQSGYDAFNRGDAQALAEVFAEDIRWEGSDDERVPGGGTHEGRDAALGAVAQAAQAFDALTSTPDEFFEQGDTVIVLGHTDARTKSGSDVKVPFVHIWRMSGGVVERGQVLTDTAVLVRALEG